MDKDQSILNQLPPPLLAWYDKNRRCLPWREVVSPYRTWVSEIMLQQTRVTAVLPYFQHFMEQFPTVEALAGAETDVLLKCWEGLGYYSRARNLQKAAQMIQNQYGGDFPRSYREILSLPGIGDYTAGAILSIAFGEKIPAVDGNVLRVAARLTACGDNVLDLKVRNMFRERIAAAMPENRPGDFNQALMDLGAMVCLPGGAPLCGVCPAASFCEAKHLGLADKLPVRLKKKEKRQEEKTVFVLLRNDAVALRRRPEKGLLAGLWEYPNVPGLLDEEEAAALLARWGLTVRVWEKRLTARHEFTHVRWDMTGYVLRVTGAGEEDWHWYNEKEAAGCAIPSAFIKFTNEKNALGRE